MCIVFRMLFNLNCAAYTFNLLCMPHPAHSMVKYGKVYCTLKSGLCFKHGLLCWELVRKSKLIGEIIEWLLIKYEAWDGEKELAVMLQIKWAQIFGHLDKLSFLLHIWRRVKSFCISVGNDRLSSPAFI